MLQMRDSQVGRLSIRCPYSFEPFLSTLIPTFRAKHRAIGPIKTISIAEGRAWGTLPWMQRRYTASLELPLLLTNEAISF